MAEHIKYEIDFIPVEEKLPTQSAAGLGSATMHVLTDEGCLTVAYYDISLTRWINPYLFVTENVSHWARFKKWQGMSRRSDRNSQRENEH